MDESGDGGAAGEDSRGEDGRQCEYRASCVHAPVVRPGLQAKGERAAKLR
jgi:hypothetical protein